MQNFPIAFLISSSSFVQISYTSLVSKLANYYKLSMDFKSFSTSRFFLKTISIVSETQFLFELTHQS